jgi:magnesium transporter
VPGNAGVTPALAIADARRRIREALDRNALIEGLVHKQAMREHDRVETLVQRQNLSILWKLLAPLGDAQIASLLLEFDDDERLLLWRQVAEDRADGVLLELPDAEREGLVARMPPRSVSRRAMAFGDDHGRLVQWAIDGPQALVRRAPVWVDLIDPRPAERHWAESFLGGPLPNPAEVTDLESSARFYLDDDGALHLYSDFLLVDGTTSRSVRVAFVVTDRCLISVRQEELPVFRLERVRALAYSTRSRSPLDLLVELYGADVEYSASMIESVDVVLQAVGGRVLGQNLSDVEAVDALKTIGEQETLNGRIRRNLMDTRRALSYLGRSRLLGPPQADEVAQVLRDIDSLDGHTTYLFEKINFLLDATVGFVNLNQNRIIRLFSVVSVALLPPTLVASIYGMNFRALPELDWAWGYPFALGLMALTVVVPLAFFRRRGWLR